MTALVPLGAMSAPSLSGTMAAGSGSVSVSTAQSSSDGLVVVLRIEAGAELVDRHPRVRGVIAAAIAHQEMQRVRRDELSACGN